MEGRSCVSVVLCTCNREKFIEEQLQSVVTQLIYPTGIVVCDDCSKDQRLEIVNTFSQKYFTIQWIVKCNTKRLGVRKNFEQAILLASEDYIATCDKMIFGKKINWRICWHFYLLIVLFYWCIVMLH